MTSKQLLKPLTLTDSQILDLVYKFHVVHKTCEPFNVEALFSVVSAIMNRSIGADDTSIKTEEDYKAVPTNFQPPTHILKPISCQMIHTAHDEYHSYAHETTMSILERLKAYSWDAKAVIALAAFSLEYGNFWHLSQVPREDNLGRSLAALNHVQVLERNRRAISDYNLVVRNAFETVKRIVELEGLSKECYEEKDVPSLTEAIREFPVFVYWAILTIVACALHINFLLGYWEGKYDLSNISSKIFAVLSKLKALLGVIRKDIAHKDDYLRSLGSPQASTEIVEVLLGDSDLSE